VDFPKEYEGIHFTDIFSDSTLTATFHLILLPSKKISLFENYLVYSRGYCLLSSLRVETTALLSTAIPHLKAPAGAR